MKINIFGKKMTTKDGKKSFYNYFTTLTKKDGSEVKCEVKFREECGQPKKVPCTIEYDKKDANLSDKEYMVTDDDTGFEVTKFVKVLWICAFKESDYIDTSLDDFE